MANSKLSQNPVRGPKSGVRRQESEVRRTDGQLVRLLTGAKPRALESMTRYMLGAGRHGHHCPCSGMARMAMAQGRSAGILPAQARRRIGGLALLCRQDAGVTSGGTGVADERGFLPNPMASWNRRVANVVARSCSSISAALVPQPNRKAADLGLQVSATTLVSHRRRLDDGV